MKTQAGVPRSDPPPPGTAASLVRAAVVAVHYADEPGGTVRGFPQLRCDVVTQGWRFIPGVPVLQRGSALYNRSLWHPQPARFNLDSGEPLRFGRDAAGEYPTSHDAYDGDHVLVGYVGGKTAAPIILGALEHPRALAPPLSDDLATATDADEDDPPSAERGNVARIEHQGTVVKLDRVGTLLVDTRRGGTANDGETSDVGEGEEAGHVVIALKPGASVVVRAGDTVAMRLRTTEDGDFEFDLGAGADERMVLGDRLMALLDSQTHVTWYGSTGAPVPTQTMSAAQEGAGATLSGRAKIKGG